MESVNRGMTGWLCATFAAARERAESDAGLLGQFVSTRDEAAFRELVRRMGPTVLGVCRRHLGNSADADDAFQTTFLVLARKAGTVHPPGRVAAWVYGVASLAARKLRQARQRRLLREVAVPHLPDRPAPEGEMDAELLPIVDEELGRLPENFRLPILLCGLRGLTIAQAAGELGWPAGTVATRLRRGRTELGKRLARRGITLAAVAITAGGWSALAAGVPPYLIEQTVAATTGGSVPPAVTALTAEVVKAMMGTTLRRLSVGLLVVLTLGLVSSAFISKGMAAPTPTALGLGDPAPAPGDADAALDRVEWDMVGDLLRQESIRKEVGLSDEAYKALAQYRQDRRVALKKQLEADLDRRDGPAQKAVGPQPVQTVVEGELLDQFLLAHRKLELEVAQKAAALLTPVGVKRLKQVVLQATGPRGLLHRVVIRELQLTAAQEDQIAAVLGPVKWPVIVVLPNVRMEKLAKEQDAVMEASLKVLTADQRKRWEALVGKPLPTVDLLKGTATSEDTLTEQDVK